MLCSTFLCPNFSLLIIVAKTSLLSVFGFPPLPPPLRSSISFQLRAKGPSPLLHYHRHHHTKLQSSSFTCLFIYLLRNRYTIIYLLFTMTYLTTTPSYKIVFSLFDEAGVPTFFLGRVFREPFSSFGLWFLVTYYM